ncbi:OmpA family protein [Moraxella sp. ZY210820]|uniref:OmpA/MotB family protein n=1 Tax=unclassified Moraxella TaxID=2685852 RepID=UPI002730826A|nr:OmpA family protein [Moraxella sp. ZY210820]WLF84030.1 OmpA family protein [Moraxella sp. ZY210820]
MIIHEEPLQDYEEDSTTWIALSDMMTGLMAIFLALAVAILAMQKMKRDAIILKVSENLEKSLKEQGLNVNVDEKTGRLIVSDETNFESGSASLSSQGRADYTKIMPIYAKAIFELPEEQHNAIDRIIIEGHTDKQGGYASNMTLSTQRANAILTHVDYMPHFTYKDQLLNKLTAVGRGENDATGTEFNPNPKDRRVIIRFEFKDHQLVESVKTKIQNNE